MSLKSHHRRAHAQLLALAAVLALVPGVMLVTSAAAGEPPAAEAKDATESRARTFTIGEATIRWHLDPSPEVAPRTAELIEEYRRLTAQRWSGQAAKSEPPQPAEIETPPGGHPLMRIPARFFHSMSVQVGAGGEFVPACTDGTAEITAATLAAGEPGAVE